MRFELLEGTNWRGDYATRRAAMADAELIAAKRGQALAWGRDPGRATVGRPVPTDGTQAPFVVRPRDGTPWGRAGSGWASAPSRSPARLAR